jgi:hypothetical protein
MPNSGTRAEEQESLNCEAHKVAQARELETKQHDRAIVLARHFILLFLINSPYHHEPPPQQRMNGMKRTRQTARVNHHHHPLRNSSRPLKFRRHGKSLVKRAERRNKTSNCGKAGPDARE